MQDFSAEPPTGLTADCGNRCCWLFSTKHQRLFVQGACDVCDTAMSSLDSKLLKASGICTTQVASKVRDMYVNFLESLLCKLCGTVFATALFCANTQQLIRMYTNAN